MKVICCPRLRNVAQCTIIIFTYVDTAAPWSQGVHGRAEYSSIATTVNSMGSWFSAKFIGSTSWTSYATEI